MANDGTYLSGTIACESIKIVAGTCVAKYAMKMRLIKSFILFRVVVVFVRFCQRLARSLFCVRTDKRNLVYYYVYTRTRRVCMCAQKSSFFQSYKRYELFQDHSTVNLKLRFVGLRAKYNRHSCHSIRARRPRAS